MTDDAKILYFPDGASVADAPVEKPRLPLRPMRPEAVVVRVGPDGKPRNVTVPLRHVATETAQERDARIRPESTVGRGLLAAHVGEVCARPWWRWRS